MTPATVERPGVWPTITNGWTDMPDDNPALTIRALTALGHELGFMSEEWADVSLGGEIPCRHAR